MQAKRFTAAVAALSAVAMFRPSVLIGQLTYQFNINLGSPAPNPITVDIQFDAGSESDGMGNSMNTPDGTAVVTNFSTDGTQGTLPDAWGTATDGNESGDLFSSPPVTLSDNGSQGFEQFNDYAFELNNASMLSFQVTLSGAFLSGNYSFEGNGAPGATFAVQLFDSGENLLQPEPFDGASTGGVYVQYLDPTFAPDVSTSAGPGVTITQVVPEPAALGLLSLGSLALLGRRHHESNLER
jgi:hypothetical protein